MFTAILMPALSSTMTEGKIVKWLKKEGDRVKRGEPIAEVETDKAIMEIEATEDGTLGEILAQEGGASVAVHQPIATLVEASGGTHSHKNGGAAEKNGTALTATAAANDSTAPPTRPASHLRHFASPLARRLAREQGVDLARLVGSGPAGRIVRADLDAARETSPASTGARPQVSSEPASLDAPFRAAVHTPMREAIARRMMESKATIPHFYLTVECEIDELLSVRERLNQRAGAPRLSLNDFIVRAVALALKERPAVNASWTEDAVRFYDRVDVAVAVAGPEGVISPVVRDADEKDLATISRELLDLAARARRKRLRPKEVEGGGLTVSNLGMYGIRQFEAIINPPQAAVLALGRAEPRAVVKKGSLAIATVMTCTLSCDHRVIDGATGAQFLQVLRGILENPSRMYR